MPTLALRTLTWAGGLLTITTSLFSQTYTMVLDLCRQHRHDEPHLVSIPASRRSSLASFQQASVLTAALAQDLATACSQTPLANGAAQPAAMDTPGVLSARKKRRLQGPKAIATPVDAADPPAEPQPKVLPKEYNNKEQAQSIRSTLGKAPPKPSSLTDPDR